MSQGSLFAPTTGTISGLTVVQDVNTALDALASSNSGASAPANAAGSTAVEGQHWLDTSTSPPHMRLYDGANWVDLGAVDTAGHLWKPPIGGGLNSLASAATVNLGSVPDNYVVISGTTAVTHFGTSMADGTIKTVEFSGALVLTYDATAMILPGGANIATAAGDTAIVQAMGGGNHRVVVYQRANGKAVVVDTQYEPTGKIGHFLLSTAPAGWVEGNGSTIGNASSGGTLRANADTLALFTAMWALDPTVSAIQTSAGAGSTRGTSAAADFAANKRIVVPDIRADVIRGLDNGLGVDAGRLLGSHQGDALGSHNHSASSSVSDPGHLHGVPGVAAAGGSPSQIPQAGDNVPTANINTTASGTGITVSMSIGSTGGAETRGKNTAALVCVKL